MLRSDRHERGRRPRLRPLLLSGGASWPTSSPGFAHLLRHRDRRRPPDRPTVVFLCGHNAGRSQMARGWFTRLAGDQADAWSGGSEPADQVNPIAVAAMAEVGVDISGERPRRWTESMLEAADIVVTMGCGDTCPFVPGTRHEDWVLEDPAGRDLAAVRPIRDALRTCGDALLASLDLPGSPP
ncbi:MAG TPA: arsenate reductase ArsC [Iamia sp.]|nr:arsenate reductase ArsC [Iamia sp.]